MQYFVNGQKPVQLTATLDGGHTLMASLWYDEFGPGWWHVEPSATAPGESQWAFGALGRNWTALVQTQPEYEARGPHAQRTFRPATAETSYWFWLDLRAASNTGVAERRFMVDLTVTQDGVVIEPTEASAALAMPGGKTSFRPEYLEFILQ